ncbi:hypothetical protein C7974DRAFT_371023 [Boeremia exigua]|uniref:uncharacterized protein n=1 Tax=Boeremia exigua TaxID=749465 RepID=UPI001E8DB367|nr:uncharacterized protein C7974DRAFT_371023 [Boeremia exigua]KAH6643828.1 hypothetical protein C7974DRAFT_371023 [Boeremia exigua]
MRISTIISSSLLSIAVSGAPVDLPKLPINLPSLGVLPTEVETLPGKVPTEFVATLPSGLPAGVPAMPKETSDNMELPVVNLPVRRADLPVVNGVVESVKIPNLVSLPTLPKAPISNVNLPVKRADAPIVDGVLKDATLIGDVDPEVILPLPVSTLPVKTGLIKKAADHIINAPINAPINALINAPINVDVDDLVEVDLATVAVPTVPAVSVPVVPAIPQTDLASRDISQSLPVVGGADVPLDAGKIQVGTVDKYVDGLVKGIKVESLPKVTREIEQSLPVVGGVNVPLDAGKIQVGTVDKDINKVIEGIALKDEPVLDVVKNTTVKDLPDLGRRDVKQTLPVVGAVDVPLDAGEIQVGTLDTYVTDVVKGTKTGL